MKRRTIHGVVWVGLLILVGLSPARAADEPVFSGPQPGEKLPPFTVKGVYDDAAGQPLDFVTQADGKPLVLVFVHQLTRPSGGLMWCVMAYSESLADKGVQRGVVWLAADVSEAEQYLSGPARKPLDIGAPVGIASDGEEGPGSLGLNRNVTLTIITARGGKVTANHALIQPGLEDLPKIAADIAALVDAAAPTAEQLDAVFYALPHPNVYNAMGRRGARDDRLRQLLKGMTQDSAGEDQVMKAAQAIEGYVGDDRQRRKELAVLSGYLVELGMGNGPARRQFTRWSQAEMGADEQPASRPQQDHRRVGR